MANADDEAFFGVEDRQPSRRLGDATIQIFELITKVGVID
jgi:hypothetical protein